MPSSGTMACGDHGRVVEKVSELMLNKSAWKDFKHIADMLAILRDWILADGKYAGSHVRLGIEDAALYAAVEAAFRAAADADPIGPEVLAQVAAAEDMLEGAVRKLPAVTVKPEEVALRFAISAFPKRIPTLGPRPFASLPHAGSV